MTGIAGIKLQCKRNLFILIFFLHSVVDDFGQTVPPLRVYLKRVLDKYPDGPQILKVRLL